MSVAGLERMTTGSAVSTLSYRATQVMICSCSSGVTNSFIIQNRIPQQLHSHWFIGCDVTPAYISQIQHFKVWLIAVMCVGEFLQEESTRMSPVCHPYVTRMSPCLSTLLINPAYLQPTNNIAS